MDRVQTKVHSIDQLYSTVPRKRKNTAWNKKKSLEASSKKKVASEIKLFKKIWPAENHHQDYEKNHPNHPYIINVSKPRIYKFTLQDFQILLSKSNLSYLIF